MIRRFLLCSILFFLISAANGFGQIAKIIEVKGSVSVRNTDHSNWQRAQIDMYLDREAEIKTARNSFCTLSFDEQLENILTIQENSHIRIESLSPGEIFLPKGRVFSLIDDLARLEQFRIRTPVAVVGVRGTGDSVRHNRQGTRVACFEGEVQTSIYDPSGRVIRREIVSEGRGVDVDMRGKVRTLFEVSDFERHEWNQFRTRVDERRQEQGYQDSFAPEPPLDAYQSEPTHKIDERFLLDADKPAWQPGVTDYRKPGEPLEHQYEHEEPQGHQPSPLSDPEPEPEPQPEYKTEYQYEGTETDLKQEQLDSFRDDMLLDRRIDRDSGGGYP